MKSHTIEAWHKRMVEDGDLISLPIGTRLVTGFPLWGEVYTDRFLAYGLPSIWSARNQAALNAMGWALILFVDGPTEAAFMEAEAPGRLYRLPDGVMATLRADPSCKYQILAAVHNLLIHKARDSGAGFHMMVADTVYSDGYFERFLGLAKRHAAIAHTDLKISARTGLPALDILRDEDGSLAIPSHTLGCLGWENFAPHWAAFSMDGITDFEEMPASLPGHDIHFVHVRGRDSLRMHCAHQNAIWIGNERCQKVEKVLGGTVDSELPRYLAGDFYIPTLADDMVMLAIVEDEPPVARVGWETFRAEFWASIGEARRDNPFLPYFRTPVAVPAPHDGSYPDDAELDGRMDRLMARLEEGL